jgi:hypothetical protein
LNRYATRRDTAERDIIEALEAVHAEVWPLDYPVDLLVRFRGAWYLLEVKTPRGKAGKTRLDPRQQAQKNFIESTGTPIVKTPMEALRAQSALFGHTTRRRTRRCIREGRRDE